MESGRGGKRQGSGRKAERGELTAPIVARVKVSNKQWLMNVSQETGNSTGLILDAAIERLQQHPEELPPAQSVSTPIDAAEEPDAE